MRWAAVWSIPLGACVTDREDTDWNRIVNVMRNVTREVNGLFFFFCWLVGGGENKCITFNAVRLSKHEEYGFMFSVIFPGIIIITMSPCLSTGEPRKGREMTQVSHSFCSKWMAKWSLLLSSRRQIFFRQMFMDSHIEGIYILVMRWWTNKQIHCGAEQHQTEGSDRETARHTGLSYLYNNRQLEWVWYPQTKPIINRIEYIGITRIGSIIIHQVSEEEE